MKIKRIIEFNQRKNIIQVSTRVKRNRTLSVNYWHEVNYIDRHRFLSIVNG